MKDIIIIGIGNILQRDDGIGVHIIKQLEKENLPSTIELVDGGTSTLSMLGYFMDYKNIIVVDSLKGGLEAGTIYKIKPEEIANYKKKNLSIHDVQILDVVKMANLAGSFPKVTIFGIEPSEIFFSLEMTDIIKDKIPNVVKLIKDEISCKGGNI